MTQSYTVVIIGSGFGGQSAAIALRKLGIDDFVILERRSFVGGTWSQNTYPGAAVDVQSPLYSLVGEPYPWTQMFAGQEELSAYTEHVLAKHRLREQTLTETTVTGVSWNGSGWDVQTAERGTLRARFVINASGPLSTPVVPPFEGRESFEGVAFHTNDWDHDFDYRGKRVAIVGSGASAAQVIPAIQPEVEALHVFQRSPHWVMPRPDRVFSGWQRRVLAQPLAYKAVRTAIYWNLETRVIGFKYSPWGLNRFARNPALALLKRQVADPQLRAKLTPNYTIGCKRIILSNTLYPAMAAANTTVHDKTDGIARIDATGIHTAQGEHVEVDAIVWSTGYDATDGVISYDVIGREGRSLADHWAEFPRAYLGTTIPQFPNLFVITGPNTGIGHTSAIFVIEAQLEYIKQAIKASLDQGRPIEVTAGAEQRYTTMIHREMERTVWKTGGCTSWYQSRSGHVIAMFPGFSFTFRRLAKAFRLSDHDFVSAVHAEAEAVPISA
ncbi:MAG: NAD(P)/FAD-dependent oxidoreductase [Solirubrobacteraceae bacterium]|nr:NAD(P)/FAD-dependent oxidoreductase [Solirubrobacteraceae bacterium]